VRWRPAAHTVASQPRRRRWPICSRRSGSSASSWRRSAWVRPSSTSREALATTTEEVADLLEAFGFERILIETVGVGQTELDIARTAETTVLVLVPESGDGIQTLKAGVMEIADIYVINKSDRPGGDRLRQEVEVMLGLRRGNAFRHVAQHRRSDSWTVGPSDVTAPSRSDRPTVRPSDGWEPPLLSTVSTNG